MLTDGPATSDADAAPRVVVGGRRVPVTLLAAVLAAIAFGLWWTWPGLRGGGDDVEVLVLADDFLADAERSITLRIREAGMAVEWYDSMAWCDDLDRVRSVVDDLDPERVVVSLADLPACAADVAGALIDVDRVAVVAGPATGGGPDLGALGFDVVDPTRLIGPPGGAATLPCEWWEAVCPPEGTAVREADGSLTEAGGERLARMLVARL